MSTDRPPPDDVAEQMEAIAERGRRRSTEVTQLAELCALEIEAFGQNQGTAGIAKIVRAWIDRAVDASAEWHSRELARIVDELADERKRIIKLEHERDGLKRQLRHGIRKRNEER